MKRIKLLNRPNAGEHNGDVHNMRSVHYWSGPFNVAKR